MAEVTQPGREQVSLGGSHLNQHLTSLKDEKTVGVDIFTKAKDCGSKGCCFKKKKKVAADTGSF